MKIIIILGCPSVDFYSQPAGPLLGRLKQALELWKELTEKSSDVYIITSGAKEAERRDVTTSTCMKTHLISKGIPSYRIYEDGNSKSTLEQISFTFAKVKSFEALKGVMIDCEDEVDVLPGFDDIYNMKSLKYVCAGDLQNIYIVTSDFHIQRVKMLVDYFYPKTSKFVSYIGTLKQHTIEMVDIHIIQERRIVNALPPFLYSQQRHE